MPRTRTLYIAISCVFSILTIVWLYTTVWLDESCMVPPSSDEVERDYTIAPSDMRSMDKFTLVFTSHLPRKNLLKEALALYSKSTLISKIIVVWPKKETPLPPDLAAFFTAPGDQTIDSPPILLRAYEDDSVMNRFLPHEDVETAGVLSMDDDLRVSEASLQKGFCVWKAHPLQMVGLSPRALTCKRDTRSANTQLQYIWQKPLLWVTGYHFVLTNFAFFHVSLMKRVWQMPPHAIQWVKEHNNCEDILFAFSTANATALPPIVLKVPLMNKGDSWGISASPKHAELRHQCSQLFMDALGYFPFERSYE